jgi:tRNA modification GTPase
MDCFASLAKTAALSRSLTVHLSCEPEDAAIAGALAEDDAIAGALAEAAGKIAGLLKNADAGRLVRDGLHAVIIGKPNTGKSSLFNAMAREDAAIVTATPGTTRDAQGVWLDVRGLPVLLTDTAGIRESEDDIEALGIARTKEKYRKAEVSIFLLDGSAPLTGEDKAIACALDPEKKHIVAINKTDLPQVFGAAEAVEMLPFPFAPEDVLQISLIGDELCEEAGAGQIELRIETFALGGAASGASLLVTRAWHKGLLESAAAEIACARAALAGGAAEEFAEVNIRAAWDALGELTGETAADDVVNRVFEEFCVGK